MSRRRIVSFILAFYLLVSVTANAQRAADPDALYRQRDEAGRASEAAEIWATRAGQGQDFESSWKLARACYWVGTQGPPAGRRASLERGVAAGGQAATISSARPEGHFWLAANMGALAESFGAMQGLKYRGRIKDALERVLAIDPAWQQGSADRALGWWYHKVPRLFGGSESRAETHLRQALTYNQASTATLYFLAEVLIGRDKSSEARTMLQRVIDAPLDPDWTPEDRDFKKKAEARLAAIAR